MAKVYYNRLVLGLMTWDKVPTKRQGAVKALLDENGYTINDDGSVSKK